MTSSRRSPGSDRPRRRPSVRPRRRRKAQPSRRPWINLLFWLGLAVVIAVGASIYTRHYLSARPASLHSEARSVADELRALLDSGRIPRLSVRIDGPEPMADAEAEWERTRFDVELAPEIRVDAAARILSRELADWGVRIIEDAPDPDAARRLRVALDTREVALVDLRASRPATPIDAAPPPIAAPQPAPMLEQPTEAEPRRGSPNRQAPDATGAASSEPASPAEPTPREQVAAVEDDLYSELRSDLPTYDELPRDFEGHEPPSVPDRPAVSYEGPPRVALIIDDGGYGGGPTERILALDPVLTLAVLPFAPHSRETAEAATARGFEVMLHMPMESTDPNVTYPGALSTSMTPEEVREATLRALEDVPGISGVNNHTGSRFTEDEDAMAAFLAALDPDELYFVDSRTTPRSRAYEAALRLGFGALSRDVFLDNRDDPEAILRQTERLIERARAQGVAIGICHFRPVTASVLDKVLDRLRSAGVDVVHVSRLMQYVPTEAAQQQESP